MSTLQLRRIDQRVVAVAFGFLKGRLDPSQHVPLLEKIDRAAARFNVNLTVGPNSEDTPGKMAILGFAQLPTRKKSVLQPFCTLFYEKGSLYMFTWKGSEDAVLLDSSLLKLEVVDGIDILHTYVLRAYKFSESELPSQRDLLAEAKYDAQQIVRGLGITYVDTFSQGRLSLV